MALSRKDIELLIRLREGNYVPVNPYVIELGAQQLSPSFLTSEDAIRRASSAFGAARPFAMPRVLPSVLEAEPSDHLEKDAPLARDFWRSLGLEYSAIDMNGTPGSIPLDLNYDRVPSELRGKFGLVTNFSTTEHICNQMNAFQVIHDLAAPGAVMIHHLPAGGALNRGLMNYNIEFFWRLARSNEYRCLSMNFYPERSDHQIPEKILSFIKDHEPDSFEALQRSRVAAYAVLVALQKNLDIPFVPPLDVDGATDIRDPLFKRRYWTVLQPGVLEAVARGGDLPGWVMPSPSEAADSSSSSEFSDAAKTFSAYAVQISDEVRTELGMKIANASNEIRSDVARSIAASEEAVREVINRTAASSEENIREATGHTTAASEGHIRGAVARALSASEEHMRGDMARFIAASEEAIRDVINRTAASSEESIRDATARALSESEERIRDVTARALSASEERIRGEVARTIAVSEEAIREAIKRAVADSEDALRASFARVPGRRYVAFVAAATALTTAAIVTAILVAARILGF